jgi:phage shock protein C
MPTQQRRLMRLPEQGQIFGVCAGLAEYFETDATLVRVIFIILAVATGGGMIIAYLILALVMPEPKQLAAKSKTAAADVESKLGENVANLKTEIQQSDRAHRARNYIGIGLVALGAWLLAVQFFPDWFNFRWDYIWPLILVIVGISIIGRNRR